MADKPKITYHIVKQLGVLSETAKGWKRELNLVSWNDHDPKYDIRDWSPIPEGEDKTIDDRKISKGITLTYEQIQMLKELLSKVD